MMESNLNKILASTSRMVIMQGLLLRMNQFIGCYQVKHCSTRIARSTPFYFRDRKIIKHKIYQTWPKKIWGMGTFGRGYFLNGEVFLRC